ncbi:MAG: DNA repair protein RecO [Candidatus Muproteobacteria bacterium RIFCSPHIGHO2_01_FULL_65_16]|uniref:DNA repair protein RecO n=2 Tax=Candidatus Muproteobacteria TaxID=1817795 RepID=A0A1F6TPR8_9PROT|nr:MAG: DNA repair protein RecO [Candidatus Muproteobacteria bacterium RIFCSPHIGHO2_01_FULL_65_16]
MREQQQPAFILHHRGYGETSLLLEAFTPNHGRLGLIAKGARRQNSRLRGLLKPFQPLLIGWSGRGELAVLTGAETDAGAPALAGAALYCGFYLNELLLRLLHRHDPHEALFAAYRIALDALGRGGAHEAAMRVFETRLLRELGYGPVLDHDIADKTPIVGAAIYDYIPERGPVRLDPGPNAPARGIRIQGASLLALAGEQLESAQALRETKMLMRALLARQLGDKPLHSRRLFLQGTAAPRAMAVGRERKA